MHGDKSAITPGGVRIGAFSAATSAPGLGSPLSHLRRDCTPPCRRGGAHVARIRREGFRARRRLTAPRRAGLPSGYTHTPLHSRAQPRIQPRALTRTGHKRHQSFGKPSLLRRSSRLRSKRRRASCSRTSSSPSRRTRCVRTRRNLRCAETSGPSLHSRALLCCARGRYYLAASVTKRQHRPSRWRAFRVYGSSVRTSRLSRPRIRCADSKAMRTSHEEKKGLKRTANDGPPMVRLGLVPLVI